jgi:hypothetical protein
MNLLRQGDEVSNLIYGGQAPTPNTISHQELDPNAINNMASTPISQPIQAQPPTQQS